MSIHKKLFSICLVSVFAAAALPVNACKVEGKQVEQNGYGGSKAFSNEQQKEGLYGGLELPPRINVYPDKVKEVGTPPVYEPGKKELEGTTLKLAIEYLKRVMEIDKRKLTIIENSGFDFSRRQLETAAVKCELESAFNDFKTAEYFHTFMNSIVHYEECGEDDCIEKEDGEIGEIFEGRYICCDDKKIYFSEELKQESRAMYVEYKKMLDMCRSVLLNGNNGVPAKNIKLNK